LNGILLGQFRTVTGKVLVTKNTDRFSKQKNVNRRLFQSISSLLKGLFALYVSRVIKTF
jgi:hypothetical protein